MTSTATESKQARDPLNKACRFLSSPKVNFNILPAAGAGSIYGRMDPSGLSGGAGGGVLKWDTHFQFWDTGAVFFPEKPVGRLGQLMGRLTLLVGSLTELLGRLHHVRGEAHIVGGEARRAGGEARGVSF